MSGPYLTTGSIPINRNPSIAAAQASSLEMNPTFFSPPAAISFDHVATGYDRGRRDYPSEDIVTLLRDLQYDSSKKLLDLGAGTGKLTGILVANGCTASQITAVEPGEQMRRIFCQRYPRIRMLEGTAEEMHQVETGSQDVVVVGTAFHWFDGPKALREIARVLAPEGRLGLIWHMLDPHVPWVAEIRNLLLKPDTENHDTLHWQQAFDTKDLPFGPLVHRTHSYTVRAPACEVIDCILSFRAAGEMSPQEKDKIALQARQILARRSLGAGSATIDIPYRVESYWCQKELLIREPDSLQMELFPND